ncbi:MAG: roadblock/LC7 domain-containing protein [Deltaproteobacteria bacterium]|nr:roadblock/LC7 domain-containing protein [Deltaproteobacteria bacterium]
MPFTSILKNLAERSGATGAVMLDWEGEIVASYAGVERLELDLIGAHHGIILDIIKDAVNKEKDSGGVKTVFITTDANRLAITSLKEGYYIVLTIPKTGLGVRAVYESNKAVARIEEEMG